ncbi:MAG: PQQ-dependent sugar dehydrogenase [Saprospiraceae bacterium]|nr:PQQ-dependent sugar dehydrogenase [Saprospiraceae bacterium]
MMNSTIHLPRLLLVCCLLCSTLNSSKAGNLPPGFAEVLVAQELDPTTMALAPDGRIFITEKIGRIRIVENDQLLPDPFLVLEVDNYNERGLSGIAFDPEFELNGYIYVYYTVKGENHNRVSRFTANGNYAVPGSETILLNIDPLSGTIHNAGSMVFGIDGKLYVSVGDGADGQAAQRMTSLRGKILRINSDGSIPDDNPFYNEATGVYRAIYALGFRNSFSMTVQPGTGRIYATEVGASNWEEVNDIQAGKNYGWPIIEGPINGQTPPDNYKEPVFYYNHADGCAAVGAAFYNPDVAMFPSLYAGKFFFADYCEGYIKIMNPATPGVAAVFATNINRPLNLLVAPDGTMYYLARAGIGGGSEEDNTATENGTLWRIFYTGSGAPFVSVNPQPLMVSVGEDARFFIQASGEQPLQYQWQQNGVDIDGATSDEIIFQNAMLIDSGSLIRCIVSNASGADTSLTAVYRVTSDQRPEPEIITPTEGTLYRAGDTLFFSGHAPDAEEGELAPTALRWKIDFHHDEHTHPGLVPTAGISEGEFFIPQTGETADDVWYKIHLSATDAAGLSKTVTREIFPLKTQFTVQTIPSGLPVFVESNYVISPVSTTSVVGIIRRVEVLASVIAGDSIRLFTAWTDGEPSTVRTFAASEDSVTFTAQYVTYPLGNGTGIRGYYYDCPIEDINYYEPYAFTRIDTTIDFDWAEGSPSANQLGNDFWLVRWEGFIQPVFDDIYNFHVVGDDGIRLWVDEQLIVDAWVPQPPTEWSGTIDLKADTQYPIRLEFFEEGGGALCQLSWSSNRLAKHIIPMSQLFPDNATSTNEGHVDEAGIIIYPNPVQDLLIVDMRDPSLEIKEIQVLSTLGQVLLQKTREPGQDKLLLDLRDYSNGMYWIKYTTNYGKNGVIPFVKF